jgi:hypothetical protein
MLSIWNKLLLNLSQDYQDESWWQIRLNKKCGIIGRISKRIDYDIKHGVTWTRTGQLLDYN